MNDTSKPLQGKIALVTGAGRGIGQAIAKGWAAAGAQVVCAARTRGDLEATVAEIRAAGGEAVPVVCDVTDHAQVKALFAEGAKAYGGLDIVLINAGGGLERATVEESDPQVWVQTQQVNLIGAYYTAREAIPYLKARGGGRILTMGSGMGRRGRPKGSAYAVAKAGLWMLVRVLAQELVEHNISVNEIIPGPVVTEKHRRQNLENDPSSAFAIPGEWIKTPEDVVPLACFLAAHPEPGPTAQVFSLNRRDN